MDHIAQSVDVVDGAPFNFPVGASQHLSSFGGYSHTLQVESLRVPISSDGHEHGVELLKSK